MDSVETEQKQVHRVCYEITREAIVRWLDHELHQEGTVGDLDGDIDGGVAPPS